MWVKEIQSTVERLRGFVGKYEKLSEVVRSSKSGSENEKLWEVGSNSVVKNGEKLRTFLKSYEKLELINSYTKSGRSCESC